MEKIAFLLNLVATFYLTGLIWLIQIVQYPFFSEVGKESFPQYHAKHTFWITPVVAPIMIVELLTAIFLVFYPPENLEVKLLWLALVLTLIVWASTFFLQVPMHEKLAQGFEKKAHRFLVNSNWLRTGAWSLRSLLVFYFAWKMLN